MNNIGTYQIDDWNLLERFIILGSEKSYYNCNNTKYSNVNSLNSLDRLIDDCDDDSEIERLIEWIIGISESRRAPKQEFGLFVLSEAAKKNDKIRKIVFSNISRFCRTFSTLAQFLSFMGKEMSWGRHTKRELSKWFINQSHRELAYQLTKYRNRNGYTPKDLLKLIHINPERISINHRQVLEFIVKNKIDDSDIWNDEDYYDKYYEEYDYYVKRYLENTITMKETNDINEAIYLIKEYKYQWEHIGKQELLKNPFIWETIIDNNIGATAFIRNLSRMIEIGVSIKKIINKLEDVEWLRYSHIHPIQLLSAYKILENKNKKENEREYIMNKILNQLENSLLETMKYQQKINKRIMVALDVSGSMYCTNCIGNNYISAIDAACTIALTIANTEEEENLHFVAFSDEIIPINIKKGMNIKDMKNKIEQISYGYTDCSAPFIYALEHGIDVDCIIVITDNETNCNKIPPVDALNEYRHITNINTKLVVMAMSSNNISIADPYDSGMLDISGIDSSAYDVMVNFINRDNM